MSGSDSVRFEVLGLPVAQGNLRASVAGPKAHLYHSNSVPLSDWRRAVASAAQPHAPDELWTGPLEMRVEFRVPQPASVPTHRGRGKKRVPVRSWPSKRPDLDKYVRAVFDALTLVVFTDDSQIVRLYASKDYGRPGVTVEVSRVQEGPTGPPP